MFHLNQVELFSKITILGVSIVRLAVLAKERANNMMCKVQKSNKTVKLIKFKQYGFSLLELAVVLGIVGVLMAGSITMYSEQRTHVKWQEGSSKLQLAKSSLLQFAKQNKFLLCPDSDGDGFENRTGVACTSNTGFVPFHDLGLSAKEAQDSWGNNLIYAINQSAISTTDISDCPLNAACYFNNTSPPMFNLSTLPVMGNPGINNLRVCNTANCSSASSGAAIYGDALVAVLVAVNENGQVTTGLDTAEQENRDGDLFFVQAGYSEAPYYDDLVETISANELKDRYESEVIALVNESSSTSISGGSIATLGQNKDTGGSGDNVQSNPIEAWDYNTQSFDFGTENANKTVTISFQTEVVGGWEDGSVSGHTRDSFVVGINGTMPGESGAMTNDIYEGIDQTVLGDYSYYDPTNNNNTGYEDYAAWYEYLEYNVILDDNGQVDLNFIVGSTHQDEVVSVSDLDVVLYDSPASVPDMPTVNTAGIELGDDNDKLDVFNNE